MRVAEQQTAPALRDLAAHRHRIAANAGRQFKITVKTGHRLTWWRSVGHLALEAPQPITDAHTNGEFVEITFGDAAHPGCPGTTLGQILPVIVDIAVVTGNIPG